LHLMKMIVYHRYHFAFEIGKGGERPGQKKNGQQNQNYTAGISKTPIALKTAGT
jgi:hypothetical protein